MQRPYPDGLSNGARVRLGSKAEAFEKIDTTSNRNPAAAEAKYERQRSYNRRYREAHPDRVAASSLKYREKTRERARERGRERIRRKRAEREKKLQQQERRRAYNRRYAEAHRQQKRQAQRDYLARRFAEDPVGFREHRNMLQREWYSRNKEAIKAKARDAYRSNPVSLSARERRNYERHGDEVKRRRREAYQRNPEKVLAYNREWKARERRRRAAGLPPRRIHRVSPTDRDHNSAAADAFFARTLSPEQRQVLRLERITPRDLRERELRDAARARAIDYAAITARYQEDRRKKLAGVIRDLAGAGPTSEEARMDDIARTINAQLRYRPQRRAHRDDPAAPHGPGGGPCAGGLSR